MLSSNLLRALVTVVDGATTCAACDTRAPGTATAEDLCCAALGMFCSCVLPSEVDTGAGAAVCARKVLPATLDLVARLWQPAAGRVVHVAVIALFARLALVEGVHEQLLELVPLDAAVRVAISGSLPAPSPSTPRP